MQERSDKRGRPKLPIPPKLSCRTWNRRETYSGFMYDNTTWHKNVDSQRGLPEDKHSSTEVSLETENWRTISGIDMSRADKQLIIRGEWVTDNIINAGQALLKKQYPHIKSLQNVLFSEINQEAKLFIIKWEAVKHNRMVKGQLNTNIGIYNKNIMWYKNRLKTCVTQSSIREVKMKIIECEQGLKNTEEQMDFTITCIFLAIGYQPLEIGDKFIQIILDKHNDNDSHWVCVSNITTNDFKTIRIFDSDLKRINYSIENYSQYLLTTIKRLFCGETDIRIELPLVTQSNDGCSGGVYALAFAQTLCAGLDPSDILFTSDTKLMRSHLCMYLGLQHFDAFPRAKNHYLESYDIEILRAKNKN